MPEEGAGLSVAAEPKPARLFKEGRGGRLYAEAEGSRAKRETALEADANRRTIGSMDETARRLAVEGGHGSMQVSGPTAQLGKCRFAVSAIRRNLRCLVIKPRPARARRTS